MKTCIFGIMLIGLATVAAGMSSPPEDMRIALDGRMNCPYVSGRGGMAFLQISLSMPDLVLPKRTPMNIAVVLDRSGSMADERKMEYAKAALLELVDRLREDDILSIVMYDDDIETIRPAGKVVDKRAIKHIVARVYPRGSTNLGGGLMQGLCEVERNLDCEYVNRVILISDGLANRGITSSAELNRIARRYRAKSISLTTIGVGLAYNENLMVGLSENGGGNYYFIASPAALASIMSHEFNSLSCILAQNATIELTLGRGIRMLDVIGYQHRNADGKQQIVLGDLYANDFREVTVELEIPEGHGSKSVATGVLRFESERMKSTRDAAFTVSVQYTNETAVIERNRDFDAQAKADIAVSTRQVEKALQALDAGNEEAATKELSAARTILSASPAAKAGGLGGKAIRDQKAKLEGYEQALKDERSDAGKSKKAIQYDNYRTQKKK